MTNWRVINRLAEGDQFTVQNAAVSGLRLCLEALYALHYSLANLREVSIIVVSFERLSVKSE